ncbi:MAG: hypothetical protein GX929_09650 [Clostridiales bacterium]|nr:hypothetical protein [Clostridiales bacterium]
MTYSLNLSGNWAAVYFPDYGKPALPDVFPLSLRVPGYWDDQPSAFDGVPTRTNPAYVPVAYPMPDTPDASLPYIVGTVAYRKTFFLYTPAPYAVLELPGISTEVWVWCNGHYVGCRFGYSAPHQIPLDGYLKAGENTLVLAVGNDPHGRLGCVTRGWKGFTGGITRPVTLRVTGDARIDDLYAHLLDGCLTVEVLCAGQPEGKKVVWKLRDDERTVRDGVCDAARTMRLHISADGLKHWSDDAPFLYTLRLGMIDGDDVCDVSELPVGLRTFTRREKTLLLNGTPVYLRGATEHGFYPATCTPPADVDSYLQTVGILRDYGFNWLRFHTSVPNDEYLTAADRLGMMIQIEAPVNADLREWAEILRYIRRHPSVVIVCCGNEELLDEDMLDDLRIRAEMAHTLAPSTLFNPQEALRGIEYGWKDSDMGDDLTALPSLHNARRLAVLESFSDVLGQFSWGYLSYASTEGDSHMLDQRLAVYSRPCLSHELGITSGYINLDEEKDYIWTRIGPDWIRLAREYMEREGMLSRSQGYYRVSCMTLAAVRKHNMETARKCRELAGYDYLGAIDYHWHRTGYQCGVLDAFYREKPFETRETVLRWNAPTVLLLDTYDGNTDRFTFTAGETVDAALLISHFGGSTLWAQPLAWRIADADGNVLAHGESTVAQIACGVSEIGRVSFKLPDDLAAQKLTLTASLGEIGNVWSLWVFPEAPCVPDGVTVTNVLDTETAAAIENGARVLLTSVGPLPAEKTGFQPMSAGRPFGVCAAAVYAHPMLSGFPHDGFADRQFRTLLEDGAAVDFGRLGCEFRAPVELVSSYKNIQKLSPLCEFGIGRGRLLVCGMTLGDTPEQRWLLTRLTAYLAGELSDAPVLDADALRGYIREREEILSHLDTDRGFDKNANPGYKFAL